MATEVPAPPSSSEEEPPPAPRRGSPVVRLAAVVLVGMLVLGGLMIATVAATLLGWGGVLDLSPEEIDRTEGAVLLALEDVSEYRAATGRFQVIVDLERDVRFLPQELAGERVLFVAHGRVDASVALGGLDASAVRVDEARETVRVSLPAARLGEATVDPERSYVFERDRGVLDRLGGIFSDSPTSERELFLRAERELAQAAQESDLVSQAQTNTETMLRTLLSSLGFTEVTVTFDG